MKLYFISGASGSGKTVVMPYLKELLGDRIAVYDFNDIGVPDAADKKWRQESTEKWLQKLLSEGKDACLLGQIVLGKILSCPSVKQIDKINFCLLDVSDFERIQRLKKRNTYGADQNMLNWSTWLRMHHQDPQWVQHVIIEDGWKKLDCGRWKYLESWDSLAKVSILDTTNWSIEQVAWLIADDIVYAAHNKIKSSAVNNSRIQVDVEPPYHVQPSTQTETTWISHCLYEFNKAILNTTEVADTEINYVIKNGDCIVAGIDAVIALKVLCVNSLWVDESYRNLDFGSKLLNATERKAKSMGAILSHLDTYGWQAKDFYIKQGYEIFGVLDDCPKGHKRYYMKKVL
ncbi:GNAT family N-acetyltransferase [Caedibacter taeniospiralis]|uniref:GNAT family N-acetyltransferase n=1 Tax=Caedibacter taeniospiralis TaxID=28907 RepID=UPI0037C1609F